MMAVTIKHLWGGQWFCLEKVHWCLMINFLGLNVHSFKNPNNTITRQRNCPFKSRTSFVWQTTASESVRIFLRFLLTLLVFTIKPMISLWTTTTNTACLSSRPWFHITLNNVWAMMWPRSENRRTCCWEVSTPAGLLRRSKARLKW